MHASKVLLIQQALLCAIVRCFPFHNFFLLIIFPSHYFFLLIIFSFSSLTFSLHFLQALFEEGQVQRNDVFQLAINLLDRYLSYETVTVEDELYATAAACVMVSLKIRSARQECLSYKQLTHHFRCVREDTVRVRFQIIKKYTVFVVVIFLACMCRWKRWRERESDRGMGPTYKLNPAVVFS